MNDNDAIRALRARARLNTFMVHNFVEPLIAEPDHVRVQMQIHQESKNMYGMMHGGAMYNMADNAAGGATSTDGRLYVTQTSTMHFLRNQAEGTVYADARVRYRGKHTCLTEVEIASEDGTVLATGEFTFYCVGDNQSAIDEAARLQLEKE